MYTDEINMLNFKVEELTEERESFIKISKDLKSQIDKINRVIKSLEEMNV